MDIGKSAVETHGRCGKKDISVLGTTLNTASKFTNGIIPILDWFVISIVIFGISLNQSRGTRRSTRRDAVSVTAHENSVFKQSNFEPVGSRSETFTGTA